jgi:hypothetical protein
VWLHGVLYFDTGITQQKAINPRVNRHVILTTGCNRWDGALDVVVEGDAVRVPTKVLVFSRGTEDGQNSHTAHRF